MRETNEPFDVCGIVGDFCWGGGRWRFFGMGLEYKLREGGRGGGGKIVSFAKGPYYFLYSYEEIPWL